MLSAARPFRIDEDGEGLKERLSLHSRTAVFNPMGNPFARLVDWPVDGNVDIGLYFE